MRSRELWRRYVAAIFVAIIFVGCEGSQGPEPATLTELDTPPSREPLTADEIFVTPDCEGWVNGSPDDLGDYSLLVVDLWGQWCPYCRDTTPHLLQTYQKYSDRGVAFLSLTGDEKAAIENLVQSFSLTWPHGYGMPAEEIKKLGVYNSSMALTPGYEIKPTFYLVSADGKVLWFDDHLRMKHTPPAETVSMLEAEIEKHLAQLNSEQEKAETPPQ